MDSRPLAPSMGQGSLEVGYRYRDVQLRVAGSDVVKPVITDNHRERFYRSVAETLVLIHAATGRDRVHAMAEVAQVLASAMQLPLVWIGRVAPGSDEIDVMAVSGRAAGYTESLRQDPRDGQPRHAGPLRLALREQRPRFAVIESSEFAPWRERAQRFGLVAIIAAATQTKDGGHLTLAAYPDDVSWANDHDLTDWAQRLVVELARFWDDQALLERTQRINRYRDAQRRIQRVLLEQPYPEAVYRSLADALVDVAGAAAVGVFAVDGQESLLCQVALAGPHAEALRKLPTPPRHGQGPVIYTPTRAFMSGRPVVRMNPSEHSDIAPEWQREDLKDLGALGCWPIFADSRQQPAGVFAIVTEESDAFDHEMQALLDEIAEATGLALRQHAQRAALAYERERQTYLALHDPLTDLPNRRALEHHLDETILRASRSGRLVAVGMLDLDDFKPINDRYGHAVGDHVLVIIAARLREALGKTDYVARLGGDEFVLVLEDLDHERDLDRLLKHVWETLRQPLGVDGLAFELTASLGLALYPSHDIDAGDLLLRRADQAMYAAKLHKHQREKWWSLAPEASLDQHAAADSVEESQEQQGSRQAS